MKYFPKSRILANQKANPGQFNINGKEKLALVALDFKERFD
mgnify:CR=1 FL=1